MNKRKHLKDATPPHRLLLLATMWYDACYSEQRTRVCLALIPPSSSAGGGEAQASLHMHELFHAAC
jgi:hypothetical protein